MIVSKYETIIHFEEEGKSLLLNGLYGTLDLVSSEIGKAIESSFHMKSEIDLPKTLETILLNRKHITSLSHQEETELCRRLIGVYERAQKENDAASKFVILPTYSCNFCCPYCFEHDAQHRQKEETEEIIMTRQQVDHIFQIMSNFPYLERKSQIEIFGGEPLYSKTLTIIEYIVKKALESNRTISATTNGFELDLFEKFLGPSMISDVIITVDGPETVHNTRRVARSGENTFQRIIDNISMALQKEVNVRVRINIDKSNLDSFEDIIYYFIENGFYDDAHFTLSYGLIKAFPGFVNELCIGETQLLHYLETQIKDRGVLEKAIDQSGKGLLEQFLEDGFNPTSNTRYCGAVGASIFFAPDGRVYACNEAVGVPQYAIGTYDTELKLDKEKSGLWRGRRLPNIQACLDCPLVLLCSGGCAYRAIANGIPNEPYCDDAKDSFSSRLKIEMKLSGLLDNESVYQNSKYGNN